MKELRRLAFEDMSDELQDPADHEQSCGVFPKGMNEDRRYEYSQGDQDRGNPKGMAGAVHRVLVAG